MPIQASLEDRVASQTRRLRRDQRKTSKRQRQVAYCNTCRRRSNSSLFVSLAYFKKSKNVWKASGPPGKPTKTRRLRNYRKKWDTVFTCDLNEANTSINPQLHPWAQASASNDENKQRRIPYQILQDLSITSAKLESLEEGLRPYNVS